MMEQIITAHLRTFGCAPSPAWIQACMRQLPSDSNQAKKEAWNLFLNTDIRQCSCGTLPPQKSSSSALQPQQLQGQHVLQIMSYRDISKPAFKQLVELEKRYTDNLVIGEDDNDDDNRPNNASNRKDTKLVRKASASKPYHSARDDAGDSDFTESTFNKNATRMLSLELADGKQIVHAVEYRTIPAFNVPEAILPGTKLCLTGPVTIRRGSFFIEPRHVQLLGGRVPTLAEQNSQLNVFKRLLDMPITENAATSQAGLSSTRSEPPSAGSHISNERVNANGNSAPTLAYNSSTSSMPAIRALAPPLPVASPFQTSAVSGLTARPGNTYSRNASGFVPPAAGQTRLAVENAQSFSSTASTRATASASSRTPNAVMSSTSPVKTLQQPLNLHILPNTSPQSRISNTRGAAVSRGRGALPGFSNVNTTLQRRREAIAAQPSDVDDDAWMMEAAELAELQQNDFNFTDSRAGITGLGGQYNASSVSGQFSVQRTGVKRKSSPVENDDEIIFLG